MYRVLCAVCRVPCAPGVSFHTGTAPRHMVFAGSGKFALLLTESTSLIIILELDRKTGALTERSRTSILPPGWNGAWRACLAHYSSIRPKKTQKNILVLLIHGAGPWSEKYLPLVYARARKCVCAAVREQGWDVRL